VRVTDENGVLTAASEITNISGEAAELGFVNHYAPLPYVTRLCGKKLFEGGTLSEGMFDFKIYTADNTYAPQGQAIGSVKNDADGNFTFPDLRFETSGVYYYVVREEVIKRLENVIYDDTVYGIMVTVTDDGNGALAAQTEITCIGGETTNEIVFENVYVPQLPPGEPDEPDKPDQPDKPGKPDGPAGTNDSTGAPFIIMIALCVLLLIMVLVFDLKGCRYWIRR
jgi:pilin isopeptide linkage protein